MKRPPESTPISVLRFWWARRKDAVRAKVHGHARPCRLCRASRRGVVLPFVRTASTQATAR